MQKWIRKIGIAMGAALAAMALFGLGKVWASPSTPQHVGEAQQTIVKGSQSGSDTITQDETGKNWRRGRRR